MRNDANMLRATPIYRALHRPQLVLGGERELMLSVLLVSLALIFLGMNTISITIGIIVWSISAFCLRKMAKADPLMSKVYKRQVNYNHYYAAFSRPWRVGNSPNRY